MIGRSLPEYVFIRLCILLLRLITPLSIIYLGLSWYNGRILYSRCLAVYAIAETAFFLFVFFPRNYLLQKAAIHPPLPSRDERESLFARCFHSIRDSQCATGWFVTGTANSIRRENMVEWLLWALFGTPKAACREDWAEEIEGYIVKIETLIGRKMEDGWDKTISCMKVSLDPVVAVHRPLVWYMIVAIVDTVTGLQLMGAGFRHYTSSWTIVFPPRLFTALSKRSSHPQLTYWIRPHRSTTKDPILFLHGIGIGLWPYISFLHELIDDDPDVGIIALETLAISMRMSSPVPPRPTTLTMLLSLLDTHQIPRVVVASHSYGTVIAAHMLRDPTLSQRVSAWLFIDPIPFLLHQPAVAYNFLYRQPRHANEWQLWYFASRDPDVARTLARHFFWAENVLWKEDIERKRVAVVLSGEDQIVDANSVRAYLTEEEDAGSEADDGFRWKKDGLEVLYYADLDHAQVFDTEERRRPLIEILHDYAQIPRGQTEGNLLD